MIPDPGQVQGFHPYKTKKRLILFFLLSQKLIYSTIPQPLINAEHQYYHCHAN